MLDPAWTPAEATVRNGSVWGCHAQAVWANRTFDTFEATVTAVVDLGDDVDTVACCDHAERARSMSRTCANTGRGSPGVGPGVRCRVGRLGQGRSLREGVHEPCCVLCAVVERDSRGVDRAATC
jgi:hypothetical protein